MIAYIKNNLMPNEKLIFQSKPHMAIFFQPIGWFIASIILIYLNFNFLGPLILFIAIIQEILMLIYYISSEYVITNQRVLIKVGVIQRRSLEIFLSKIEGIYINQGMFGRIFNFGDIDINGIGGGKNVFNYVPDPLQFRNLVQAQINLANK